MPGLETDALCGRHKVSLNRGPKAKSETPRGPFLSEKGFLTPPSFFSRTHATLPLATLSPLPLALPLSPAHPSSLSYHLGLSLLCGGGEPTHGMMGMASRADSLDFQVESGIDKLTG